jgi:hypothetical protein
MGLEGKLAYNLMLSIEEKDVALRDGGTQEILDRLMGFAGPPYR